MKTPTAKSKAARGSTEKSPRPSEAASRTAKGNGNAPVQACIAAIPPGWKREISAQIDALVTREVPTVLKAVKWRAPFYAYEGKGWFLSFQVFNRCIKLTFFNGASLNPPLKGGTGENAKWIDIHEDDFDQKQLVSWIKQAATLPGWGKPQKC